MCEDQAAALRLMLADFDAQLLAILTGARPLADAALTKAATLECARSAVQRLLEAGEPPERTLRREARTGDHA